jgi:hypothetical protein
MTTTTTTTIEVPKGFVALSQPWEELNHKCMVTGIKHEGFTIKLKESDGNSTRGLMGEPLAIHGVQRVNVVNEDTFVLVAKQDKTAEPALVPVSYFDHTELLVKCLQGVFK